MLAAPLVGLLAYLVAAGSAISRGVRIVLVVGGLMIYAGLTALGLPLA